MSAVEWASRAHKQIVAVKDDPTKAKQMRTLAMNAPVLVRQAGAVQAVAFWRRTAEGKTFSDSVAKVFGTANGEALLKHLVESTEVQYVSASRQLVEATTWLRRFAQSELESGKP
jgi:CRISPR/Cas system CMR-associated protein Cmr5 small subunit